MSELRIDQINVVIPDVAAAVAFLAELGVEIPPGGPGWEAWDPHHRGAPAGDEFEIELDSSVFAQHWGGLPPAFTGVVLNLRIDERVRVDELHARAVSIGARSLHEPYDAFWGSRFAVVEGPGPIVVGFNSVRDPDHFGALPDPATLG